MVKKYEQEKIEDLKGIYLLDFYADWCGPCKMLGQVLETIEDVNIIKTKYLIYIFFAKNVYFCRTNGSVLTILSIL